MKIKVEIKSWKIQDENGNSPVDEEYIQDQFQLPETAEVDAYSPEEISEKLYEMFKFYPAEFTWSELQK